MGTRILAHAYVAVAAWACTMGIFLGVLWSAWLVSYYLSAYLETVVVLGALAVAYLRIHRWLFQLLVAEVDRMILREYGTRVVRKALNLE